MIILIILNVLIAEAFANYCKLSPQALQAERSQNPQATDFDQFSHVNAEGECVANECSCPGGFPVHPSTCQSFPVKEDGTNNIIGVDFNPIKCMAAKSLKFKSTINNAPSTEEPSTDEPATDEPSTDEPSTNNEPSTDDPLTILERSLKRRSAFTDKPSTDEPSTDEPRTDETRFWTMAYTASNSIPITLSLISSVLSDIEKKLSNADLKYNAISIKKNSITIISVEDLDNQLIDVEYSLTLLYNEHLLTYLKGTEPAWSQSEDGLLLDYLKFLYNSSGNPNLQSIIPTQILPNVCTCADGVAKSGDDCDPSKKGDQCAYCTTAYGFDNNRHVNDDGKCVDNVCSCPDGFSVHSRNCQTLPITEEGTNKIIGTDFNATTCLVAENWKAQSIITDEPWDTAYSDSSSPEYVALEERLLAHIFKALTYPFVFNAIKVRTGSITILSVVDSGNQLVSVEYQLALLYDEKVLTFLKKDLRSPVISMWSQISESGDGLVVDYLEFIRVSGNFIVKNSAAKHRIPFVKSTALIEKVPNICTCSGGVVKSGDDCDPSKSQDHCTYCRLSPRVLQTAISQDPQASDFDDKRHVNADGKCVDNECSCPGGFPVHPTTCQSFPVEEEGTNKIIGVDFDPIKCMAAKSLKFKSMILDEFFTDEFSIDGLSSGEPSTEEPGTEGPGTEGPGTEEPSTDDSLTILQRSLRSLTLTDEPSTDEPSTDAHRGILKKKWRHKSKQNSNIDKRFNNESKITSSLKKLSSSSFDH